MSEVVAASLRFFTPEDVLKVAVMEVTEDIEEDALGNIKPGGLYDFRMGPLDQHSRCATCGQAELHCPGHLGYIKLPHHVFNPLTVRELVELLNCTCPLCQNLKISSQMAELYHLKLLLLDMGLYFEAVRLKENPFFLLGPGDLKEKETWDKITHPDSISPKTFGKIRSKVMQLVEEKAKAHHFENYQSFIHSPLNASFEDSLIYDERVKTVNQLLEDCRSIKTCFSCKEAMSDHSLQQKIVTIRYQLKDYNSIFANVVKDEAQFQATQSKYEGSLFHKSFSHLEKGIKIYLYPEEIFKLIQTVWLKNKYLMETMFAGPTADKPSYEMFFMKHLPVMSNKFRPPAFREGKQYSHPMNAIYRAMLALTKKTTNGVAFTPTEYIYLQKLMNQLYHSGTNASDTNFVSNFSGYEGVKNDLEKKSGLFRGNIMGKRVNFTARSVILPDPNVGNEEVSVPKYFAMNLTFGEPVNNLNLQQMRQLIINGAYQYPGANFVDFKVKTDLSKLNKASRIALSKQITAYDHVKVHRHLVDGDVVIMNRQPTLHRPSMMAHKVRVIHNQKTIRMHYANCDSYNADFDGDEMNMHAPQNFLARAESYTLLNTPNQYVVPTSGEVIRGLIQDYVASGVLLTKKDTFLNEDEFTGLLYHSLFKRLMNHNLKLLQPCICKPQKLWSGKQVISTVLIDICSPLQTTRGLNLTSKCKVKPNLWGSHQEEGVVLVRNNQLLTGVLDKSQIGASNYGLIHSMFEAFGSESASELINVLTRLLSTFLQSYGVTCGIDDCLLHEKTEVIRSNLIKDSIEESRHTNAAFSNLPKLSKASLYDKKKLKNALCFALHDDKSRRRLDGQVKATMSKFTTEIMKHSIPNGMQKLFPKNFLSLMTESGAKGSIVNASQISCLLGQQEFEGRRVKASISGKTLPSFEEFETTPMSGGYIASRFLTGIKPQEYYFHCMAGRDGLIDTAVKTARSGYLQRCLIKHLETLKVAYDYSVRDNTNAIIQFTYGGDAIDPIKSGYMTQTKFFAQNSRLIQDQLKSSQVKEAYKVPATQIANAQVQEYVTQQSMDAKLDPIVSTFTPGQYYGILSEKISKQLEEYISSNPDQLIVSSKKDKSQSILGGCTAQELKDTMHVKYLRSLIDPGEPVGILAAQSIGEPSTQMTLNTFHFAGLDQAHVTVGIPRLRELMMLGSSSNLVIGLPIKPNTAETEVKKLFSRLNIIKLSDVLQDVQIFEELNTTNVEELSMDITLEMAFDTEALFERHYFPKSEWKGVVIGFVNSLTEYVDKTLTTDKAVTNASTKNFSNLLSAEIFTRSMQSGSINANGEDIMEEDGKEEESTNKKSKKGKKQKNKEDDEDEQEVDDTEVIDEDGAEGEKAKSRKTDEMDYEEDGEEEEKEEEQPNEEDTQEKKEPSDDTSIVNSEKLKTSRSKVRQIKVSTRGSTVIIKLSLQDVKTKVYFSYIIETIAKNFKLQGVGKANIISKQNIPTEIQVECSTFDADYLFLLSRFNVVDFNSLKMNHVQQVTQTYGIEAARQLAVQEISQVFDSYGIGVDERHISLIVDYMTSQGIYGACNRRTFKSKYGPLTKITFESSVNFLKSAAYNGEVDNLAGPSSRLMFGRVVDQGTGLFEVYQDCQ